MTHRYFTFVLFLFWLISMPVSNAFEDLTPVKVQLKWLHQFQFAGYYAAIEKGYYEEQGLSVELFERKPGPTPIDKLIYGEVDYAVGGVGALFYRANNIPLVALAAVFQHSPSILISRYPKLSDLKGKKVMLSRGVMNAEIIAMLKKHQVSLEDINVVPTDQSLKGFIAGEHDAYNGYTTNETYHLMREQVEYYSFYPRNDDIDFYGDILLTTEAHIERNLPQVQGFRAATLKGWEYAIENIDEMVALIQKKYNTQNKTTDQLTFEAEELVQLIFHDIVPIGYMSEQRWQEISTVLNDFQPLTTSPEIFRQFLFENYEKRSLLILLRQHAEAIFIGLAALIGMFLLYHNYRLKLEVKHRTEQLVIAREQAEFDARTDSLTGLSNRRYFMESIAHDISIARRNGLALSIISIDIDWFKKINDLLGHAAGDEALVSIAKILQRNVRSADTLARVGGEEFIIVSLEKNNSDALHLAERIREDVESSRFTFAEQSYQITISLGVASLRDDETIELLLNRADEALYRAKENGRNQVVND